MNTKEHWETIYSTRPSENLGWYKPHLNTSLNWIEALGLESGAPIIDVGGGMSSLVDDLVAAGHKSIHILDISETALSKVRSRVGEDLDDLKWIVADIRLVDLPSTYFKVWHDRAVFHFLTRREDQQKYCYKLNQALKVGGHFILGVFSPEAPPRCSGLDVKRYTDKQLLELFSDRFELLNAHKEKHVTPSGVEQMYLYCHFKKIG